MKKDKIKVSYPNANTAIPTRNGQFPQITDEDHRFAADWSFAENLMKSGAREQWCGQFVGIYREQVVAVGERELGVRDEFSKTHGIPGEKLAVMWVEAH